MSSARAQPADRSAGRTFRARRSAASRLIYRLRWPLGGVLLLAVSALLVGAAEVRPGYDHYGWLVWGHLTLHGKLDTNGAPSWKPLPYLFTLPYALAGRDALYLWMTTAFAVSLSGMVFAWRVAFWLVGAPAQRRYAAYAAGLVAALAVAGISRYPHSVLSAESDTMIVALCLAAVDCMLCRRYRWAFWLWWLAALGRPEAWVLLGLYLLWAWRQVPAMRWQMVAGVALVPLLWFGIPALTSKSLFSPATLAENSPRALHGNKITGTFGRFLALNAPTIKITALAAVILAALRRDRRVLALAAGVVVWVAVEILFALHGWSAVPRYIYEAGAGLGVLAGVFVGLVILDAPHVLEWMRVRVSPQLAGLASLIVLAGFALSLASTARSRVVYEREDLSEQRTRASEIKLLDRVVDHLGAARILACGHPNIRIGWQSALAWDLGTNVGVLFYNPNSQRTHPQPVVNMYARSYGWSFFPSHTRTAAQTARCSGLTYRT
ncbi:MAG: hypothetical protein ACRDNK_11740 [Solirubrobacteraceae bacterium]